MATEPVVKWSAGVKEDFSREKREKIEARGAREKLFQGGRIPVALEGRAVLARRR